MSETIKWQMKVLSDSFWGGGGWDWKFVPW